MLVEEARWFESRISELSATEVFPMLNVGSSTGDFRARVQPWIDRHIFEPVREAGHTVIHLDLQEAEGVDVVGDLTDPRTLQRLTSIGPRSVVCSNLLEHVSDRKIVCDAIASLLPRGGYAFVSCPYRYPRHDDPFDTMYRPNPAELATLFPSMDVVAAETLVGGTYYDHLGRNPARLLRTALRLCLPMYAPKRWLATARHLHWLARHFEQSCIVLRKR